MQDHFRELHVATSENVLNGIYNMTPEEEEALLLEYGVSNVITDELLPQIAAPSTFQSEYGTRDVFLTAETNTAHANEGEESSSSCSSDDDDDDNGGDDHCSNVKRHNRRWRKVAKICELTHNDVFTNSLQRLLMKYTSSYSYLTSETLLQATESAMHDLQKQHRQIEQENSSINIQTALSTETPENNKISNNWENMELLYNDKHDDSNYNNINDKNGDDEEVNDDIIMETNQLLREANNLINKSSEHNREEWEQHKQEELVNSTNFLDDKLSELAYNALWTKESEVLYDEEFKKETEMEMMESNAHSHEMDKECVSSDKEIEELLADARKHIAQLRTIQKRCADGMTNTFNGINRDKTIENKVSDDNDQHRIKSSNEKRNESIMENVNTNSGNKEQEVMILEVSQQKQQQEEEHECEELEVKDLNVQVTNVVQGNESSNEHHDNHITFDNEDNAEVEITNDCSTKWDDMHTEWENAYRTRQNNFHSMCSAQRIRTACYVDPVHLGEFIQCNVIDHDKQLEEKNEKISVQVTDNDSTHEINSQFDKSHFDVERHKHLSIMESVNNLLEESTKEESNNNNNDDKTVDDDYSNPADILQSTENETIASAMPEEANDKATIVKSKEKISKEILPYRRHDIEGYATLPLFVERVDELLEPSGYEYAPEAASFKETESSYEEEHRCHEHEQSWKVESSINFINENTQHDVADKTKSSSAVKNLSEEYKGNNAAVNIHAAEYKNMLKSQLHASKQHMREKWRVEHELTEYHRLCKEDDEAQMRELQLAIWLAECEDKLHECDEDECNSRLQLVEHENSMREELCASALMHKQLIINVMRAKQEEKLKLLISYLEHEQNSEYTVILHQERECWQNLIILQQKQYNELYEAELLQRRIEEERRRQQIEEMERVYWLPENVRSRALTQEKEIMESWFSQHASHIQNSLDAIAEELAICCDNKHKVQKNKSVVDVNIWPSSLQRATITFADSEDIANKNSEEKEELEQSLNSRMLVSKLREIALENNKLDKLTLSQLRRYAYNLSFSSSHIKQVDNASLQNCHGSLSWTDEETHYNLYDGNNHISKNCYSKIIYATLVRDVDLSENTLEKLQLAVFLRSFPALQVLKLNKNNLSTLSANLTDADDNNYKSNYSGNRSLRSVKAVHDNAISEQTHLHTLDISHNKLTNVDEIATLLPGTLTRLHAHNNAITSIAPLVTCTRLQELNLAHNAIHSLNRLHTLRLLRYIDISYNTNKSDDPKASYYFNNNNEDEKECDLSPICNNCLLLQKLYISHNHINVMRVNDTTHCSVHEPREHSEESLSKQQEEENGHCITYVKPNVFMFMTELYIDHNQLINLSVEIMPYLPMLTVLHAEYNAITDISGLMHCPRLVYVDLSHNALATWKDLRPIMYCEQLTEINLLCNPCLCSDSNNNEYKLCNEQSTFECYAKHKIKMRNSKNATCCTENRVWEFLVQWLPKLQKLNNMPINNNINHNNNSNAINVKANSLVNTESISELPIEQATDQNYKECKNNIDCNSKMLTLDKSICKVCELWEHFRNTHASRMLTVQKWETEWRQEAIKRSNVNYISPDPAYIHQLTEIANIQELTFLQCSLQHYLYRFRHQEDKATESWSKLTEFVHKNSRLLEQEQIAHVTLCKWLEKYISVWRAKKLLVQLREEMKIKEQKAKWMSALCVLQPVGRGAILRMRLRHVLSTRIDTKQQSNYVLTQHHLLNSNASKSGYNENSAAFAHDDDDKLYVKVNEELPQLLQSISCTSDTGIVNLLRKVNVKQVPVPVLPLLQTPSSPESVLPPQSTSNTSKPTNIDQCNLLPSAQTQREALKVNDEKTQLSTQNVHEQSSVLLDNGEGSSDESAYSAIVSAQMAKKRKKMNRQHEQVMKEEFIHDPLKVKKMRQKDQTM